MDNKLITLEDFEKARQTILKYKSQDFSEMYGNDKPCICCESKIKPHKSEYTRFPQSGMYIDGMVDKISAGYGSDFDGNQYIIAICDTCIERLTKENKIQFAGNYMHMY